MINNKYPEVGLNYQGDLNINKNQLDAEWLTQPQVMMTYSKAHAQAIFDRDRAKQSLDVTKAGLDSSIRQDYTIAGAKFTEAVVDGAIRQAPTFMEAQTKLQEAEYKVNLLLGAIMAFNARKAALENLVKLYLSGYWAEPRSPQGDSLKEAAITKGQEAMREDLKVNPLPNSSPPKLAPTAAGIATGFPPPQPPPNPTPVMPRPLKIGT